MSGKWTPGPWKALVISLLSCPPKNEAKVVDKDFREVAYVCRDYGRADTEISATAKLMATSPELFDALADLYSDARELLVEAARRPGHEDLTADELEERGFAPASFAKARAALAKAMGEGA